MNEVKVVLLHSYLRRLRITPELSERPSHLAKIKFGRGKSSNSPSLGDNPSARY